MEELLTTNENSPVYVSIGQIPVDHPRYFGLKNKACKEKYEYYFIANILQSRYRWPGWKGITVEPCGLWETKWEKLRKGSSENEDFRGWSSIFQKKSQICIACHESYPSTHEVSIYFIEIATLQNLTGQTNRGPPDSLELPVTCVQMPSAPPCPRGHGSSVYDIV